MKKLLGMLLAGGQGSRLSVLSYLRAKPAVPFAGKYRIIDFTLSNCVNSGIYDVAVLTQYIPHSLMAHIGIGKPWDLDRKASGVRVLQPYVKNWNEADSQWYKGTADAIYQNLHYLKTREADYVLILSGDHIYRMDYNKMLEYHIEKDADLTIAAIRVKPEEVKHFGIIQNDDENRIIGFEEKPDKSDYDLASMGIYIFKKDVLIEELEKDAADPESSNDFGKNVIPSMLENCSLYAYPFEGYWKDVGTISAYLSAHLDLIDPDNELNLYDRDWDIYTRSEENPPVKYGGSASVKSSILCNGTIVNGTVEKSVISPGVIIEKGAKVIESVILNNCHIKAGTYVYRSVVDKNCFIGENCIIGVGDKSVVNKKEPKLFHDGITVVGKLSKIPSNTEIGTNCKIGVRTDGEAIDKFSNRKIPDGETIERIEEE